ncbi:MAG: helix-turn-helix domain-containing protein [Balneolaceae bacterium]|nr:helix-turn-helix domain-containing protein [Balneolaceae bacterium]
MKIDQHIKISKIIRRETLKTNQDFYSVIWIIGTVKGILIDGVLHKNVSNSMFFLNPRYKWKILKTNGKVSSGYIMYLSDKVLNEPSLSKLQINEVRILHTDTIHKAQLAPGIQNRVQTIIEMLEELLTTHLNHREDAILALVNTFFVYCDGQCNIKSSIDNNSSKASIVYSFKKLLSERITEQHDVIEYAEALHISPKYLNECVQEVLQTGAKSLIIEQLGMRARHTLKFSDKSIKEIAFDLGFSFLPTLAPSAKST